MLNHDTVDRAYQTSQWVASDTCTTSDCRTAPNLFNASESLDSGFETDFQYHRGEVSGNVYWEQIQLGGFGIGYQAFREFFAAGSSLSFAD